LNKQDRINVFKKAASIVRNQGLGKSEFLNPSSGCACTYGATMLGFGLKPELKVMKQSIGFDTIINRAEYIWPKMGTFFDSQSEKDLRKAFDTEYRGRIYVWNDDPETTADDVIALFNKAIDLIEAEDAN
jgi:hypothetical protein